MGRKAVDRLVRSVAAIRVPATHHSVAAYDRTKRALTVAVGAVAVGGVLWLGSLVPAAQTTRAGAGLRTTWGEPDLMGVWQGPKLGARPGQDTLKLTQLERLYRPEARATMKQLAAKDDPARLCVPQSFPHAAVLGWPIQILQHPGQLLLLNEAFLTHRNIPTDGRGHVSADRQFPMFLGDSAGHWEGDTLVVDVISFNGLTWLAGSQDKPTATSTGVWPTSDALHVVERWRRVDADTLEYQARVEDPTMLTGPWETAKVTLKRQPVKRVKEVKCVMDNPAVTPNPATYLAQFGR